MYSNLLVPYDSSVHAQNALKAACELARLEDSASITVINVTEAINFNDPSFIAAARMAGLVEAAGDASSETKREFFEGKRKALADEVQQLVGQVPDGVELKFAVDSGRPQDCIVDYAQKYGIDCVVMGRRGLGAIRGALGSVSYAVLRSVDIPVLVVK